MITQALITRLPERGFYLEMFVVPLVYLLPSVR